MTEISKLTYEQLMILNEGMNRIKAENRLLDLNTQDYARNMKPNQKSQFFNSFKNIAKPASDDPVLRADELAKKLGMINGR